MSNWGLGCAGLSATGSIDYGATDVFVADDMIFPIKTAQPLRQKELFSLGVIGIAAMGHTAWCMGRADASSTRSPPLPAAAQAAPALWVTARNSGSTMAAPSPPAGGPCLRDGSLGRDRSDGGSGMPRLDPPDQPCPPAKSEVHETACEAAQFAYRAGGGASLRDGVIQRVYRDIMVAVNHITNSPSLVTSAARDVGGLWDGRVWSYYDLAEALKALPFSGLLRALPVSGKP
jgi:hypothetical protein